MSEARIRELLAELRKELEGIDDPDKELQESFHKLSNDVEDAVNPEIDTSENTILDDAIALEARFAASYPVAEKTLRELINSLSRIGI